jgi:hypothetical protein
MYFQLNKYARFWEDWNPEFFEVKDNLLIVKNKSKELLWDIRLPTRILFFSHSTVPGYERPVVKVSDLDTDGRSEIIVGIRFDERNTGKVLCFNYKKEKLWEFSCGEYGIYQTGDELNNGYFSPYLIEIEDLDGDSKKEVLINSGHSRWFPNQFVVLDYKGNKTSEYWHPGIMSYLQCLDFDKDGQKEIILGGINNRVSWRPVLAVLSPKRISGQAMPYISTKKIEKAKEKWYIVFPHLIKRLPDESKWEYFLSSVNDFEIFTNKNEVDIFIIDGRTYYLTLDFKFGYVYFNYKGYLWWKGDMRFPTDPTEEDEENWKNIEVYKEGVRIR